MDVVYGQNIAYKTEAMYNASANLRYIAPDLAAMSGTQLPAAQGNRLQLLKYWNSNRETFLDSRYGSDKYSNDKITLRSYAPKTYTISLTPDTNMYVGVAFDVQDSSMPQYDSGKLQANSTWSYTRRLDEGPEGDKNTYIFGASHLLEVDGLQYTVAKNINLSPATKLRRLILGTDDPEVLARQEEVLPTQLMIITMPSGVSKNMTEIDLHNLKYLRFGNNTNTTLSLVQEKGSVKTNLMPSLKTLNIKGTNINNVVIGDYTPLQYLGLSDEITTVALSNLPQLTSIDFGNTAKISTISITNCVKIDQLSLLKEFYTSNINFTLDNLQGTEETRVNTTFMDTLYSNAKNVLSGTIYVEAINETFLTKYTDRWPNLDVQLYRVYPDEVIFGATGEGGLDD